MGEVAITKASAATRLLNAAILMFFRCDDELATHLTASACGRLLSDMYERAGGNLHLEGAARGLHQLGLDFIAGTLPEFAASDPFILSVAEKIGADIQDGIVTSPDDINISVDKMTIKEIIRHQNKSYNFLKHADIDAFSVLEESELDNISAITRAVVAYAQLFPKQLTSQMQAFVIFRAWQSDEALPEGLENVFPGFRELSEHDVRALLASACEEQIQA